MIAALLAAAWSGAAARLEAQHPEPGTTAARWTTAEIRLDGLLDEGAWEQADSVADFRQLDPDEGAPASERTVVRFVATEAGLYVGLRAHDRAPGRLYRSQLRHDSDLASDDSFTLLLDPQLDRRTGYLFAVNPNGAMYDAEIQGPDDTNADWDGLWDARATPTPWGWSAELYLPWRMLRYPGKGGGTWGLNLERFIARKNEVALWRGWRRHQGLLFQEAAGTLAGLDTLPQRPRAEVRPYVAIAQLQAERVYDGDRPPEVLRDRERDARIGADAKLALAPTLTLDLTVNSDFAQAEADEQVLNLTRFPLLFPEKRPFFMENAGIFQLGEPGEVELFYSRRIGLSDEGAPLPIDAGARLHGREGPYRIGALAVRTGGAEPAMDLVARLTRDVLARGRVGAMLTSRHVSGTAGTWSAGVDAQLPLLVGGQNLVLSGYGATSRAEGDGGEAYGLFADYPNDWSDSYLGVSRIDEGFDPALGYLRDEGIRRYVGGLQFFPRTGFLGSRRMNLKLIDWDVANDADGSPAYAEYEVRPFGLEFHSGEEVELNLQRFTDVPEEPFEIFPGRRIPAGSYRWDRVEARYLSPAGRQWTFDLAASVGRFYDGTSREVEGSVEFRAAPHLITYLDYAMHDVRRPGPNFIARVARVGVDLAASPRFGGAALLQWDNESERLGMNLRLHWRPNPGTDLYLAWNSVWPTAFEGGVPWRRPEHGVLTGKVVHYLRW